MPSTSKLIKAVVLVGLLLAGLTLAVLAVTKSTQAGIVADQYSIEVRIANASPAVGSAPAAMSVGRVFSTGFESIGDFAGFYIVPPGHMGTASHEQTTEQVHGGTYAHKGWLYGTNTPSTPTENNSHRAYPTIQLDNTAGGGYVCPCEITFWVWLDMPLDDPGEWFSFATFTPDPSDNWEHTFTLAVSAPNPAPGTVAGGVVYLMHVPNPGEREPTFQTSTIQFPQRQWVELKTLIDFDPDNGQAEVFQDGQLVSSAQVNGGNGKLEQAHFGMYADAGVDSGVVYNDDLEIREAPPVLFDADGDGCTDVEETGMDHILGGQRSPTDPWDFYDVDGTRSVGLSDTLLILNHFGHAADGDALDNLLDRYIPNPAQGWRSAEANNGVGLVDALANLRSFGDSCTG